MSTLRDIVRLDNPGRLEPDLPAALEDLDRGSIVRRIWERDATVWKPEGREIADRLGWLTSPTDAEALTPDIERFAASLHGQGLSRAVVLGMGGSSLAPEVYGRAFATGPCGLEIEVLDTTEPGTVAQAAARLALDETLFLVSSKSGTTAEALALLSYFYDRTRMALGTGHAGSRFAAITDPGTPLEALARDLGFRRTFRGRPDIGGRFSALSVFGLVPAALKGLDLGRLLAPARLMAESCRAERAADNPGAVLGAILGAAAGRGMNKLTLMLPQRLRPLAGWLEQLVAESTGKEGRGIVPVVEDRPGPAADYSRDRLFVEIGPVEGPAAKAAGPGSGAPEAPLVRLGLDDPYDLAAHFFLWEFATAVAGHLLGINPFDQPDVEATKRKTREVLAAARSSARSPKGLHIAGPELAEKPARALARFLDGGREGDYLALLAFLPRRPAVEELLSGLAAGLRIRSGLPVTVGFGPRYLHSTGQLHKGDGNRGLFVMLVASELPSVGIPAVSGVTPPAPDFGGLFRAQAEGDARALTEKGRRVLVIEIGGPVEPGLAALSSLLE